MNMAKLFIIIVPLFIFVFSCSKDKKENNSNEIQVDQTIVRDIEERNDIGNDTNDDTIIETTESISIKEYLINEAIGEYLINEILEGEDYKDISKKNINGIKNIYGKPLSEEEELVHNFFLNDIPITSRYLLNYKNYTFQLYRLENETDYFLSMMFLTKITKT